MIPFDSRASPAPSASRGLVAHVEDFLRRHGLRGARILVAFSGGPDSTALLWSLVQAAPRHGLALHAAHLDHGADEASGERAERARESARNLGVPLIATRLDVPGRQRPGEAFEEAARRLRYEFLRRTAGACGARWIAVGHHRDDQAETVLLRLLFGTGIPGLAGMSEVTEDLLRPLLSLDRALLRRVLSERSLPATEDPGNADLGGQRNRVRHLLLPRLAREPGFSAGRVVTLATAARGANRRLRERLSECLDLRALDGGGADLDLAALRGLPAPLHPFALALLHERAGAPRTPPAAARRELTRQVEAGDGVGCDCGGGWRWSVGADRLLLRREAGREVPEFSYTLRVPGELSIPEIGVTLRMVQKHQAPWMIRGSAQRAAMSLPLEAGQNVLIRNRRPGDRLRPLGCSYHRKLKDVLIDRRVDRERRDALPLLLVGDRIAWVPGVTIEHDFRLEGDSSPWVAELLSAGARN